MSMKSAVSDREHTTLTCTNHIINKALLVYFFCT